MELQFTEIFVCYLVLLALPCDDMYGRVLLLTGGLVETELRKLIVNARLNADSSFVFYVPSCTAQHAFSVKPFLLGSGKFVLLLLSVMIHFEAVAIHLCCSGVS